MLKAAAGCPVGKMREEPWEGGGGGGGPTTLATPKQKSVEEDEKVTEWRTGQEIREVGWNKQEEKSEEEGAFVFERRHLATQPLFYCRK